MKSLYCAFLFLCSAICSNATTFYVDASKPDDTAPGTDWWSAKKTIQAAVDIAAPGDLILVTNGVYNTGGEIAPDFIGPDGYPQVNHIKNRVMVDKALTVRSVNGPEETIIEGEPDIWMGGGYGELAVRCAYLTHGAVLEGFTLTQGHTGRDSDVINYMGGGAVVLESAQLNRCIIKDNSAAYYGGGVFLSLGALNNCAVSENFTMMEGGGVFAVEGALNFCTVYNNQTDYQGGGVSLSESTLNHCIVWDNHSGNSENIYEQASIIRYSCSTPLPYGEENIEQDPRFMANSFKLLPDSPCIEAGENINIPSVDLQGNHRPMDGDQNGEARADLGCMEWDISAMPSIWYVNASQPDDYAPGTSWAGAKQTIQAAIDLAAAGDLILVTNGTYSIGGTVAPGFDIHGYIEQHALPNRVCLNKALTVRSMNGPEATIIDGTEDGRCAYLVSGALLEGFTLKGGVAHGGEYLDSRGGGAFLEFDAHLERCIVKENYAVGAGGGIYSWGGSVKNSAILENRARNDGGGMAISEDGVAGHCSIVRNRAERGGGLVAWENATVYNSIVWENEATQEQDNIFGWSQDVSYTCSSPLFPGSDNIDQDPLFSGSSLILLPDSPCIDRALTPNQPPADLFGNPRPFDGDADGYASADMGCTEWDPSSMPSTWYVDASRPDDSAPGTSWEAAKKTIQAAIDAADAGDLILVTNGVYDVGGAVAPDFEFYGRIESHALLNRVCLSKAVTVRSVNGPEETIIDGGGVSRCAYLIPNAILEGFNLKNGVAYRIGREVDAMGGGAFLLQDAELNRCIVSGNFADDQGGGVLLHGGRLSNCFIVDNDASMNGGGVCISKEYSMVLNCTVVGNQSDSGGGIIIREPGIIYNSIVWGNQADYGDDNIAGGGGITFTCSYPQQSGEGNIDRDPLLLGATMKLQQGSPCIDAGSSNLVATTDLLGNERPFDGDFDGRAMPDMGCTEWDPSAMPTTWYVDAARPHDFGDGQDWWSAKRTIQAAIDAADDGDVILVTNGVYDVGGAVAPEVDLYGHMESHTLTNCVLLNKAVTVRSLNGPEATIIDGMGFMRCAYLFADAVLEGFTLRNGFAEGMEDLDRFGGGAFLLPDAQLVRCIVKENYAREFGGGVITYGGYVSECAILENVSDTEGGGVLAEEGTLNHCTITRNRSMHDGGGLRIWGDVNLANSIVWDNQADDGDDNIAGGGEITFTCSYPQQPGEGNIDHDPLLRSTMKLQRGSPCIDAGSSNLVATTDLLGNARPFDGDFDGRAMPDMGCTEWDPSAMPTTWYVDAARPHDFGDGQDWWSAKRTIQAAIDAADDGDVILVTNGVYDVGGAVAPEVDQYGHMESHTLTNCVLLNKAVTVRSLNGPEETIIDGMGFMRCAYLFSDAVLEGFTLRNGFAEGMEFVDRLGGGAFLLPDAQLVRCIVKENHARELGGGVFSFRSHVSECAIVENVSDMEGGGVLAAEGTLNHCTITRNRTMYYGGGLRVLGYVNLSNSIVWDNQADDGGDNIAGFGEITFTCSYPQQPGEGNIESDPRFVDPDGDYRLQYESPCINTGNTPTNALYLSEDLAGNPRILDGIVDMGCYEFDLATSDSNRDGIPDRWYLSYGLDCTHTNAGGIDHDGDLQTTYEEFVAGFDPTDETSYFSITNMTSSLPQTLEWPGVEGRVYSVYWSTNLLEGFEALETNIHWSVERFTVPLLHEPQAFYRLGVELEP